MDNASKVLKKKRRKDAQPKPGASEQRAQEDGLVDITVEEMPKGIAEQVGEDGLVDIRIEQMPAGTVAPPEANRLVDIIVEEFPRGSSRERLATLLYPRSADQLAENGYVDIAVEETPIGAIETESARPVAQEQDNNLLDIFVEECEGINRETLGKRTGYWDFGDPVHFCHFCNACFWYEERSKSGSTAKETNYWLCCTNGKIELPKMRKPPKVLEDLIFGTDRRSKHFLENIRSYNSMFAFTSLGGKIDAGINTGKSPPTFRMHGQNYHLIGSLVPTEGCQPKFAQLYIYDTENEVTNRLNSVRQENAINRLHGEIIADLKEMLDEHNVLVKSFRMVKEKFMDTAPSNIKLRLIGRRGNDARRYNLPSVSEVAALIVGDFEETMGDRDIIVETQNGKLKRINELNAAYLGLQYPLLFPFGEDGYREDISFSATSSSSHGGRKNVSIREFFAYRMHEKANESTILLSAKRLFQQFVVDAYTMVEAARLTYVRTHQKHLRVEKYKGLNESRSRGDKDSAMQGKRVILPSSFTGGARFMVQNYQDAMAICKWAGFPNLFITFTCNPQWPEIVRYVNRRGLRPEDRPDIIARVFKMKLDNMLQDMRQNNVFGRVRAVVYTVEFQKRGLPHAHILLFLSKEHRKPEAADIDKIISAEIPEAEANPEYYRLVQDFMIHGPCGTANNSSPCMSNGRCTKYFPKKFKEATSVDQDGYPIYKRRENGRVVVKNGVALDNRFVVPHNQYLLLKYAAHINVEWCNQSRSIKYLFKYINKGHDRVTVAFDGNTNPEEEDRDEVKKYYDCRYISPCEAAWRIFGYEIHYRYPSVERLGFHLPDEQCVVYADTETIDEVHDRASIKQSMFLAWLEANKKYPEARELTYPEFPSKFVWHKSKREWLPRQKGIKIGRIFYVPLGSGEMYYLRCLLNIVRGPTCYEEIRCINGVQYATFREACHALGLLNDDKEYIDGIQEASQWASAHSLRNLFATLLSTEALARPEAVWDECWIYLSDDILYKHRKMARQPDMALTVEQIKCLTLSEIEKLLRGLGTSLRNYSAMPFPSGISSFQSENSLIAEETRYAQQNLVKEHEDFLRRCTDEQRGVYEQIMNATNANAGGMYFVYGYGGTGKTFVWKGLSAAIRSKGDLVINVASSGIAALLLPGGRTAHSRFKIPLTPNEDSTCEIEQGSPLAELLVRAKLIIWDEAPMMHRFCFEALDRTLRDIMRVVNPHSFDEPFGGKTIVLGGDFRQILPIIPKGSRQDVVHATINASYLWENCIVLRLTKNMRIQHTSTSAESVALEEFTKWIADIGDGALGGPNDGEASIDLPEDILLKYSGDPIAAVVENIYASSNIAMAPTTFLQERAILAPTLDVVDAINRYMVSLNQCEGRSFLSSDSTCQADSVSSMDEDVHTPEFLNSIKCSGVPNHELYLKVGTPVMLLRNLDHANGLCNGTRLVITRLGNHVLEAKVLTGQNASDIVLIPRMSLIPSDPRLPFKFQRRQFPLTVSYAMTINKSQGQSLKHVGLVLKKPVFSHGQLYVAVSRVTSRSGLKVILWSPNEGNATSTTNVVFKEVFANL